MRDNDGASSDGARPIQPRPAVRPGFPRPEAAAKGVRVLEADPDLGIGIGPADWQLALQAAVAPAFEFKRGSWRFFPPPDRGGLGALVLSGMIVIRIEAGARAHLE